MRRLLPPGQRRHLQRRANDAYAPGRETYFDEDPNADPDAICEVACADFPTDVLDGVSQVDQHFGYGDTVQCRLLHHQQGAIIEGETGDRNVRASLRARGR